MKAIWRNRTIAQSDDIVTVEGNHYFPIATLQRDFVEDSTSHSHCHWKGQASYYHIVVEGQRNEDAAWYYPDPQPAAQQIRDRVAFWHGVEVVDG